MKTHKFNVPMYTLPPHVKKEPKLWIQKSLYMMGRKRELDSIKAILNRVYKNEASELVLIRGVMGSGKSLFVRRLLYDFLDTNRELKSKALQHSLEAPFVFVSYQMPTTYMYPFNGWKTIFQQIHNLYLNEYLIRHKIENVKQDIDSELVEIILLKSFKGVPLFTLEIVDSLIVNLELNQRKVISTSNILGRSF